ncbi:SETMR methyltransferase, partial [Acromyrmex charruanus]
KKNEFRTVIKHLHMKDLTPKEIKAELYLAKKKVLFHQDNARVHRMANEFRYELLSHPAYSPNLAPREQLIETEAYFEGLDKSYYSKGLKKLENRWIKCIELKGDYVEK